MPLHTRRCELQLSNYCPWGKGHLRDMVQQHAYMLENLGQKNYNEVILDSQVIETNAPRSIEAVFTLDGSPSDEAQRFQRQLVEHFGIPRGALPMLSFDLHSDAPFSVVD